MTHSPPVSPRADAAERHFILGTAGHIDHGKTSLVRALTGVDTDRLPEEQRRGMTIELGFAALTVGDMQFGVVDVPGHERFVRTMVAGATGIDIALLVVAADDSVMPQTVEHVDILHLLGVEHAVVVITKIDAVPADMAELVAEEVRQLLAGTPLAAAPLCPVSSLTGEGVETLKGTLRKIARRIPSKPARNPFRLAVDRVFTVPGRGTVVTGSVLRGMVGEGDTLEVFPGGRTCRVRDLQCHGAASARLSGGQRAAINVSGVDRSLIVRGSELATPGYLHPLPMVDVRLRCLASYGRPLRSTRTVRLCLGTRELPARVVLLDGAELAPGAAGYAQLRGGEPLFATYGQRFIIRDESAMRTIGGGVVLRPVGRRRRLDVVAEREALEHLEHGGAEDRVEQVLRLARFTRPADLAMCAAAGVEVEELPEVYARLRSTGRWAPVAGTTVHVVPAAIDDLTSRLTSWLERFHRAHPELPGRPADSVIGWLARASDKSLARPLLDRMLAEKVLRRLGRFVCLPAFAPALSNADEKLLGALLEEMRAGGFQPPALETLSVAAQADRKRWERLASLAVALGELVEIAPQMYLHAQSEQRLREMTHDLIAERGPVTVAEVREALNSSRKYVVPFVEYLDRIGFTKRTGDRRVLAETESLPGSQP